MYLYALYYRIFMPIRTGKILYRNMPDCGKDSDTVYDFDEDFFYSRNPMESSTARYDLIQDIKETEDLFLLYTSSSQAIPLSKDGFGDASLGEFRTFIEEKAQVDIERIWPKRTVPRLVGGLVALAAIVLVGLIVLGLRTNRPIAYTDAYGTTIQMPAYYRYSYDDTINLYDAKTRVYGYYVDLDGVAVVDYAQSYIDSDKNIQWIEYQRTDGGIHCARYYYNGDGGQYYYTTAFVRGSNDICYVVHFWCEASMREDYEMDFLTWADTIKVE